MPRRQFTPEEKSRLVLQAIRGERTVNGIASENSIRPNVLSRWKSEAGKNLYTLFRDNSAKERRAKKAREAELQELYARIGRLATQNERLKKNLVSELSAYERRRPADTDARTLPVSTLGRPARPEPLRSVLQAGAAIRR